MKYTRQIKNNIHLIIAFTVLIVVSIWSSASSEKKQVSEQLQIDTIIPRGYVLVPIELENKETIQSLIQSHGLIDLYLGNPIDRQALKIATKIKLIRAPYNPHLLAVLVKEDLAERIMKQSGHFYAVIQNKSEEEGSNSVKNVKKAPPITIDYQNEENIK